MTAKVALWFVRLSSPLQAFHGNPLETHPAAKSVQSTQPHKPLYLPKTLIALILPNLLILSIPPGR